mmetsp:Transcript_12091/g.30507  ORF Transcript_12091/g.30507 Transcript_12091/m.30507 type:complete len:104 (-) Transcript_12091:72-383(-)
MSTKLTTSIIALVLCIALVFAVPVTENEPSVSARTFEDSQQVSTKGASAGAKLLESFKTAFKADSTERSYIPGKFNKPAGVPVETKATFDEMMQKQVVGATAN